MQKLGIDRYIQQQLNPDSIPESSILAERLAKLDTIDLTPSELFQRYNPNRQADGQKPIQEVKKAQQHQARQVTNQAIEARLWRSIYSDLFAMCWGRC